jgi:hypothetical protein
MRLTTFLLALFFLSSLPTVFADDATAMPAPTPYAARLKAAGVEVGTMAITCGAWSNWITSTTYCAYDPILSLNCVCTTLPMEVEFTDQYQWRVCTNSATGHEWTEYNFRTRTTGCCGMDLPFCF